MRNTVPLKDIRQEQEKGIINMISKAASRRVPLLQMFFPAFIFLPCKKPHTVRLLMIYLLFGLILQVDHHAAIGLFALAAGGNMGMVLKGGMEHTALIGIHWLKGA